jgi:hypothetical protein
MYSFVLGLRFINNVVSNLNLPAFKTNFCFDADN